MLVRMREAGQVEGFGDEREQGVTVVVIMVMRVIVIMVMWVIVVMIIMVMGMDFGHWVRLSG